MSSNGSLPFMHVLKNLDYVFLNSRTLNRDTAFLERMLCGLRMVPNNGPKEE